MYEASSAGEEVFYIPIGPWGSDTPNHSSSEVEAGRLLREDFMKLVPRWAEVIMKAGAVDSDTMGRWLKVSSEEVSVGTLLNFVCVQAAHVEMHEMNPPLYAAAVMTWAKRSNMEWAEAITAID